VRFVIVLLALAACAAPRAPSAGTLALVAPNEATRTCLLPAETRCDHPPCIRSVQPDACGSAKIAVRIVNPTNEAFVIEGLSTESYTYKFEDDAVPARGTWTSPGPIVLPMADDGATITLRARLTNARGTTTLTRTLVMHVANVR
jgi:hypothetical protein